MNTHPAHRHPATRPSSLRPGTLGPVPRRSFPSVRADFIQTVAPTLNLLAEIDKMCDELLKECDSKPPPCMWDEEPPTIVERKGRPKR